MKVLITDKVGSIPTHVKQYAESKVMNLEHYFNNIRKVEVVFKTDGQQSAAQMTVSAGKSGKMHAEATADDYQSVVDILIDKIEPQITKAKEKTRDAKRHARSTAVDMAPPEPVEEEEEVTYEDIIRGEDV